ncbi:unnamed protein product, partial [Staurois parvus]
MLQTETCLESLKNRRKKRMMTWYVASFLQKKKMSNLKKEREDELHRQTVERRDRITELLAAQMKQKVDDEEECIAKAVAEIEAKKKKETQEKEKKIKADIKAIT